MSESINLLLIGGICKRTYQRAHHILNLTKKWKYFNNKKKSKSLDYQNA